jgi:cytochrome c oxidase subunit 2
VVPSHGWWLPKDVSTTGARIDFLFYLILYVTGFFFVLTEAILVYCMWVTCRGRSRAHIHGNHNLEAFWTAVTSVILIVVAVWQIPVWPRSVPEHPGADHVAEVSARQFEAHPLPNDARLNRLREDWKKPIVLRKWTEEESDDIRNRQPRHLEEGRREGRQVRVLLKTRDVLHSFFLPNTSSRTQPGKMIPVWFEATQHNIGAADPAHPTTRTRSCGCISSVGRWRARSCAAGATPRCRASCSSTRTRPSMSGGWGRSRRRTSAQS